MFSSYDTVSAQADAKLLQTEIIDLISSGQVFRAHDLVKECCARFPDITLFSLFHAQTLCQTGANIAAREIIDPIYERIVNDSSDQVEVAIAALRGLLADDVNINGAEAYLVNLSEALSLFLDSSGRHFDLSGENTGKMAEIYFKIWRSSGDERDLQKAVTLYSRAMMSSPSLEIAFGAALANVFIPNSEASAKFALEGLEAYDRIERPSYSENVFAALCMLLVGRTAEARNKFKILREDNNKSTDQTVPFLRILRDLDDHGVVGAKDCMSYLELPRIMVFTGHELDRPGSDTITFTTGMEQELRQAISKVLDETYVTIGYALPRCGCDLIFLEMLIERGIEINIILPSDKEDFFVHHVEYGGPEWHKRFRKVLRMADSVSYATVEKYLGHESLNRFANQYLHGSAILRARHLETQPYLLAVWDMKEGSLPGGAADFIDQWEDISRLRIIDLDEIKKTSFRNKPNPQVDRLVQYPDSSDKKAYDGYEFSRREIKSMMFADIVGFSKLEDDCIPDYISFCNSLYAAVSEIAPETSAINTWGDAFFVVMDDARSMVEYALAMRAGVQKARSHFPGAVGQLDLRISLHAGPVYVGRDPFRNCANFYGAHINRAARLEPVTIPGRIYATSQFVSLLTVEEAAMQHAYAMRGESYRDICFTEYVGVISLAKGFGAQSVYHLRPR